MSALEQAVNHPSCFLYLLLQSILNLTFPPLYAKGGKLQPQIIAACLTGVSSAAHSVGHGFDVKIFGARSREHGLGGIWSVHMSESLS
jgi:hypothetical protein